MFGDLRSQSFASHQVDMWHIHVYQAVSTIHVTGGEMQGVGAADVNSVSP